MRKIVQFLFLLTIILIGIQFALFVCQLEAGRKPSLSCPPGIEAFLPISSFAEYRFHVHNLDQPFYQHNRGQVPACNMEAWLRMMRAIRRSDEKPDPAPPAPPSKN